MSAKELKSYLSSEAESGSFAGGIAAIAHAGMVKSKLAFGYACLKPEKKPVTGKTIYDLASLTKPLVTTLIILYLIQSRLLSMDSKLGRIFGSCPADKKDVTIKNLLCHSSGIQSWFPLYTCSKNLSGYSSEILKLPLTAARNTQVIYSCPNFILLADIIQRITSLPFNKAVREMVFKPLNLTNSFIGIVNTNRFSVAATEENSQTEKAMLHELKLPFNLRKGMIHGEVHDGNSFYVGGSAGNAGLFANIEDALSLADQFTPRSVLLSEETRNYLTKSMTPFGRQQRVPGWQLASSPDCSAGPAMADNAIGHTGFTGTSLWWDPQEDLTYFLFTNRIHPEIRNTNINPVRTKVHSLLKELYFEEKN